MDVGTAPNPVHVQTAGRNLRIYIGHQQIARRARTIIDQLSLPSARHRECRLIHMFPRRMNSRHRIGEMFDRHQRQIPQHEIARVTRNIQATIHTFEETNELRFIRRIRDLNTHFPVIARNRIHQYHVRAHDPNQSSDGVIISDQRIEVVLVVVHTTEVGEVSRRGIVFDQPRFGCGADPQRAIRRLINSGGKRRPLAERTQVLHPALRMLGIESVQVGIPCRTDIKNARLQAAKRRRGKRGILAIAHGKLAAMPRLQIDIQYDQSAIVLPHGHQQGCFACGSRPGV